MYTSLMLLIIFIELCEYYCYSSRRLLGDHAVEEGNGFRAIGFGVIVLRFAKTRCYLVSEQFILKKKKENKTIDRLEIESSLRSAQKITVIAR